MVRFSVFFNDLFQKEISGDLWSKNGKQSCSDFDSALNGPLIRHIKFAHCNLATFYVDTGDTTPTKLWRFPSS